MSSTLRALRGATTVDADTPEQVDQHVQDLVHAMLERNEVDNDDLVSILFSATSDVRSRNPATSARQLGLTDVPLLGLQEMDIDGMLPLTIRVLMHWATDKPRSEMRHVFLRGATVLRPDLAVVR